MAACAQEPAVGGFRLIVARHSLAELRLVETLAHLELL